MVLKQWLLVFGVSVTLNWVSTCYSRGVSGLINSINFHAFKELLIHLKHLHRYQFLWRIFVSHLVLNSVSGAFSSQSSACVYTRVCEHRLLRLATPLVHEATTTAIIFIMEIQFILSTLLYLLPPLLLHCSTLISKVWCVSCHLPPLPFLSLLFFIVSLPWCSRRGSSLQLSVSCLCARQWRRKLFDMCWLSGKHFCIEWAYASYSCIVQHNANM